MKMLEYKGYFGAVDADDGNFSGRVIGLRDVITFEGETFAEVEQAFRDSIDDYLAFCAERGEQPDRTFSGKIPLRVPPDLHRRAAARAEAEGLSLNQWITKRIDSAA
jgi:predicted HicB family RNase H-like nuclease